MAATAARPKEAWTPAAPLTTYGVGLAVAAGPVPLVGAGTTPVEAA